MRRWITALFIGLALSVLAIQAGAAANNSYYYSQLDAAGQEAYNAMLSNRETLASTGIIDIPKPGLTRAQASSFMDSTTRAVSALNYDHPEIFWLSDWQTSAWRDGTGYTITLNFNFSDNWTSYGSRSISEDVAATSSRVSALASQARSAGASWYDQLGYVHDWLTHNNLYNDYAASLAAFIGDSTPWVALSALDTSLSPVCEGYARAFKLVCDELGVPCVLACGQDHMWNCVQMEDGQWYAVDATYDDPVYSINGVPQNKLESGGENRKYFLVGREGIGDHPYDRNWTYPVLSASNYVPGAVRPVPQPAPQPQPAIPAPPVSMPSSWALEEVNEAIRIGLVPDGLQSDYQDNITRAEFAHLTVVLLERCAGISMDDLMDEVFRRAGMAPVSPFQDTGDINVVAAYFLGIVNGRTQTTFDPYGSINRQEAAAMLARTAELLKAPVNGNAKSFNDSAQFAPWAVEAIAYVSSVRTPYTNKAVMGGVGHKMFNPYGTYTREQAIVASWRLFQTLEIL